MKLKFIAGFLFAIFFLSLQAKDYTLKDVLNLAVEQNKQIRLARADREYASALKKEAWSTALPKLNVELGYNRNFLENFFYVTVTDSLGRRSTSRFVVSFKNEYQLNAVMNQTLFSFGKIGNAIQGAGYFTRMTNYQYDAQFQAVMTSVKKAFYQALLLQKVWEVAQQSEQSAADNYEETKIKFEGGVVSEFELLQAEVRWQNTIPETMKARKNFELALNNLKALIDAPLAEEMHLVGELEKYPPIPEEPDEMQIFEKRPDYNALMWEKKLQEKRVAVEFANHLPTLSGNLIYTYGARSDAFRLENDNDNFILGLNLSIPIFSGGYTSAQVQKARVDVKRVKTRIDMANDNIRIEVKNAHLRMREASQRILAARKGINTARRAYDIAETRVRNGLATQLELKDSRVFLDQAQLNYYTAIYDYLDAYFDWQLATGNVTVESEF